jgi:hypothetical protein
MSQAPTQPFRSSFLQRRLRAYFQGELAHVFRSLCAGEVRAVQLGGDGGVVKRMGEDCLHVSDGESCLPPERVIVSDLQTLKSVDSLSPGAILIPDALPTLQDVQATLQAIAERIDSRERLMVSVYSSLWDMVYRAAEKLGLKARPERPVNWVNPTDLENLLRLTGHQVVRKVPVLLCPIRIPLLDRFLNRVVVRLPLLRHLAMSVIYVARLRPKRRELSVSVVIPARNERDNLKPLLQELPKLGSGTELIIVEGHSIDGTYERALELAKEFELKVLRQEGIGKADAVRAGFDAASGDVLMIYDADRTVPPDEVSRFYQALASGEAEFANGTRTMYPMEDRSMRFLNKLGNRAFTLLLSYILDYPIRDTLCGTKVFFRRDYSRIRTLMEEWSSCDPFGDFELLFGARYLNLAVIDVPVHYRSRRYGTTQIHRWRDGVLLARFCLKAMRRMVFF